MTARQRPTIEQMQRASDGLEQALPTIGGHAQLRQHLIILGVQIDHLAATEFRRGTYVLRWLGVTATCTAGAAGLARAWINAARRRISARVNDL